MTANGGSDEPAPVRRLYGRSSGKALRVGQARLFAEALPRFSIAPEALAAGRGFAAPPREVWLEIGFGAGEHLIDQAKANLEKLASGLKQWRVTDIGDTAIRAIKRLS